MPYINWFPAVADLTHRMVLEALAREPSPVGRIAGRLPVSRPAVSQHLKVLSDAGLVDVRAEGTRQIYSIRPEGFAELRTYLDSLWTTALNNFAEEVSKQKGNTHD